MKSFQEAEKRKRPNPEEMFYDVHAELTPDLQKQLAAMKNHVAQHKEHYPLDMYEKMKV